MSGAQRAPLSGPRDCGGMAGGAISLTPEGGVMSEQREQRTEERIVVREVTHLQASWAERERGAPGAFTFQLILDQGADEYVLLPSADDAEVLLRLFKASAGAMFDRGRKVLMFRDISLS
jgi:hypothetical protein